MNRLARGVERELRRLVRSNVVRAGRLVTLPAVPIPFLASAPLLEGAWIDLTVLELAESGAILADRGCCLRGSGDAHRWPRRSSLGPTRRACRSRSTRPPGARPGSPPARAWGGIAAGAAASAGELMSSSPLYQRWRARTLGSRLEASTETGFLAESWNDWVKNQGAEAALAGVPVEPLTPLVDRDTWTVHDADLARGLQTNRADLLANLRSSALSESGRRREPTPASPGRARLRVFSS